jgi:two-component system, NtrC family, sensor histidine kinase AtoS
MTTLRSRHVPVRPSGRPRLPEAARSPETARPHSASSIDDAFFRHIVSGMRNGVLAITRDGRLALINDEAYRIFGVTPSPDDGGRPLSAVLKEHPDVVRALTGAFELHHLPNRVELRLKPSGKVIGYTLALVRDDAGIVVGASMFFRDLTRVEQIEERERLRDRLAAVGEMAAVIAHEVKNPLGGIEVMAGLLKRKLPDVPDAQSALSDIIKEAKMANAIVQEVLDFVRPIRLQVEHTTVVDAVRGAVQLAETKARRGAIDVQVDVPEGLPQIDADQHQLTQVFTNLLMNAYEAMNGKGHVRVTASLIRVEDGADGRDSVLVEIADDGPGIPEDVAQKVFEPFFTTKAQGSGLGLAIVRKIVDAHDGRLDLRTTPGQGTTMRVTLPISGNDEE